jgi:hypothetical protein
MTDREAMKLALEALEQVTKELLAVRDELAERGARPTTNVFHQRLWDSSFDAYTNHAMPAAQALRTAIAEAESVKPIAWANINKHGDITHTNNKRMPWSKTPLYTIPPAAQPAKQKPVAWLGLEPSDMPDGDDPMYDHDFFLKGMVWADAILRKKNATPPEAQRQPLTEERIWELAANCLDSVAGRLQFARAIEAAHGITGERT